MWPRLSGALGEHALPKFPAGRTGGFAESAVSSHLFTLQRHPMSTAATRHSPVAGRRSPVAGHYFCHHYGDKLDFSRGLESGDGLVEGGELAGHNSGGKETTHDRSDLGAAGGSIFANAHAFYDAHESEPVVGGRSHDRLDRDIHDVPARFVTGRVSTYNGFLGFEQTRVVGKKAFGFVSGE